jgi:hypothetical protein
VDASDRANADRQSSDCSATGSDFFSLQADNVKTSVAAASTIALTCDFRTACVDAMGFPPRLVIGELESLSQRRPRQSLDLSTLDIH